MTKRWKHFDLFVIVVVMLVFCSSCASLKGAGKEPPQALGQTDESVVADEPKDEAKAGVAKSEEIEGPGETVKTPPKEEKKEKAKKPETLDMPEFKAKKTPRELPPKEPIDAKKLVQMTKPVLINAESMPLSSFIVYAVGDVLKVTYVLDEPVMNMKNPVTLKMSEPIDPVRAMEIVLGFLAKYDLNIEEKSGALYISKTKPAMKRPVDVRVGRSTKESGAEILQVVPLNHVKAGDVDGIVREMYKTGVTVKAYPKENALMLTGQAASIREIVDFISVFDVPYMQSKKPFMVKLTYWQPDDFAKQLSSVLDGLGFSVAKAAKEPGVFIIPIKVLNSVLVVTPDDQSMKYVFDWVGRLDNAESAGSDEKSFIFAPKYSKASDLVESLDKLYGLSERDTAKESSQTGQSGQTGQTTSTSSQSKTTTRSARSQQTGGGKSVVVSTGLRIAADDRRNVVLVSSTPSKYKNILNYLTSLDVPPKQVLIEATIAELTLKGDLQYGLEWYVANTMKIPSTTTKTSPYGPYTLSTLGNLGVDTAKGLAYTFISDDQNFKILMNAFAQDNRLNILSSPRIMVIDNQDAHIQIGTDVPIISGQTTSTAETTQAVITTQSVQYRSTGLMVTVKPNINTEGMMTLEITIESSEAQTNTLSDVNSPLILTRKLTTNVVAASDETIVIGGLMSENVSRTETKVPLLGDIPYLGNAFKNTSKSKTKTELLITLKPIIMTNTGDAVTVSTQIREGMKWFK